MDHRLFLLLAGAVAAILVLAFLKVAGFVMAVLQTIYRLGVW